MVKDDDVWRFLSFMIFMVIYSVMWMSLREKTMDDIDDAFRVANLEEDPPENIPLVDTLLMRNLYVEKPPYNFFSMLWRMLAILFHILSCVIVLFIIAVLFNLLIMSNLTIKTSDFGVVGVIDNLKNQVVVVLVSFYVTNVLLIFRSVLLCLSVIVIIGFILKLGFPDQLLDKQKTKVMANAVLFIMLFCIVFTWIVDFACSFLKRLFISRYVM